MRTSLLGAALALWVAACPALGGTSAAEPASDPSSLAAPVPLAPATVPGPSPAPRGAPPARRAPASGLQPPASGPLAPASTMPDVLPSPGPVPSPRPRGGGAPPALAPEGAPGPQPGDGAGAPAGHHRSFLANLAISMERLETVTGTIDLWYSAPTTFQYDHTIRFAFKKPFKVAIEDLSGRISFYYADWKATVWLGDRKEAAELDLSEGWGVLLQRFFALFEMSGFLKGVVLSDVESQFEIRESAGKDGTVVEFIPRPFGIYRLALGLRRIQVRLDAQTHRPLSLLVFQAGAAGAEEAERLLCRARIESLFVNGRLSDETFVMPVVPGVRRVDATDVVWEWVESMLEEARSSAYQKIDAVREGFQGLLVNPFGH